MPTWSRAVLRVLFALYVIATVIHIGYVVAHEPFAFDAWNVAVDTHAQPITPGRFFHYWLFEYTHSNPRFGQPLTYLAYKLDYFAVIATPLAFVAISLAVTVLGTARWPFHRGRDLALWAIAIGFAWFALPSIGMILFCRAYCANYVYGAAIQLWFLVPIRFAHARGGTASTAACAAYFAYGIIAGLCNEHTGPTLVVYMLAYAAWTQRKTGVRPTLIWSGAFGAVIGFAAIFFAPGQGERYEGAVQKVSLVGRMLNRGINGNLDILRDLMLAAAPLLAVLAIAAVVGARDRPNDEQQLARRRAVRFVGIAMFAGVTMACTIFVSPKLGPRFYLGSMALLLAGFIGVAEAMLSTEGRLAPFVALAIAASGYAATHTIYMYGRLDRQGDARLAALAASKPGSVFIADAFEQVEDSWWFLGDDFRDIRKREMVATYFDLAGVVFRAYDVTAPLGTTGVQYVPRVTLDPPGCLDTVGGFAFTSTRGYDISGMFGELHVAIAALREQLAGRAKLLQLDMLVEIEGTHPPLPRKDVMVARWRPDLFEGWAAQVERSKHSKTRDVLLPKELKATDFEIYVYEVGGEAKSIGTTRSAQLEFVPWKTGTYWVLACRTDECFVISASRQVGG